MSRPELVYQLMNLANHHALWNSRRGAAYGFASIMARSREYLQPHLATLIPLLYRYQFDPSKPVQRAMEAIWQALVDDPRVALHDHFDAIFQGLLSHIGHHLWRVREASCMAMAELLQTRGADAAAALTGELEALWQMAFRALDDIKESVGLAGLRLCRVLQTLTLQLCDASATHAREAKPVLATVIPFLLQQGLSSVVAAVKAFSLQMLLQLCNQGGALLQPHAVDLVATLLERLSDIEPQSMNELSFHVDKLGMTTDQLDRMRLNATHMSPVMQATDQCLDQVTSTEAIAALVPKLQHLIRRGMGLATRAGVARALTLLCMKKPHLLRLAPETGPAHASALIKALSGALLEPSAPLRSAWATAIGYLAPLVAKDITIQRLVAHLERLYQEHIDQDVRAIVPTTMLAMSRHALERLQTIGDQVLPLVYFGMRDRDESVRDIWSDVWTDCNGGKTQTATLYQDEILRFNIQVLQ
ncbi:proteasome component M29, partial [Dimargaris xerosporica]